ncbi:hypothetical protein EV401DRAFT_2074054 [Pisolithus croceorrhizus]|nr:hypothetical protein EV401DRAFT_2074054 [Pisolithus croceorrhizus]
MGISSSRISLPRTMLAIGITRDVPAVSWFKSEYPSDELVILSGTLRFTTDTFNEYQDAEIRYFEALRRVHLLRTEDDPQEGADSIELDVFRSLDSPWPRICGAVRISQLGW